MMPLKARRNVRVFAFLALVGLIVNSCAVSRTWKPSLVEAGIEDQNAVQAAVKLLWSSRDDERRHGVQLIRQIGTPAIDSIVVLLTDLVHDQRPRFATGEEQEGANALSDYLKSPERAEFAERVGRLAINQRLMKDCVALLSDFAAVDGVPILIEIMNRNPISLISPEVTALRRIGSRAVPELVKDLEEDYIRKGGFEVLKYGWRVHWTELDRDVTLSDSGTLPQASQNASDTLKILRIRQKVVWLLGEIGDELAIPPLQHLLAQTQNRSLISMTEAAITQIQNKPQDRRTLPRLDPIPARPPS